MIRNEKLNAKPAPKRTVKYLARQREVLSAATHLLNRKGLRGMTRAEVAAQIGIVEGGLSYYFSSKEALAAACFQRAIKVREGLIAEAAQEATPTARIARLLRSHFELSRRVALGEADEVAVFDDLRALGDVDVEASYVDMFRNARKLLRTGDCINEERQALNLRTHWLLQQLIWVDIWLTRYGPDAYARAAERMIEIITRGIEVVGQPWPPPRLVVPEVVDSHMDHQRETFLIAATQLINIQGYRGASVEKIAARLDLTKGAFYYHIDAKDDLVAVCFARTAQIIRRTLEASEHLECNAGARLAAALISLVEHQILGDVPLLRAQTVSLPDSIRKTVLQDFERNAVEFGSIVSDGVADASLRALDVQIAAQMITSTLNAAAELYQWIQMPPAPNVGRDFVRILFKGLFA